MFQIYANPILFKELATNIALRHLDLYYTVYYTRSTEIPIEEQMGQLFDTTYCLIEKVEKPVSTRALSCNEW